ncbi:MAG: single-stranded-DNA-specific exonuclease RecJ [Candidatus Sericytochromatia bacterium]|nr:single-stranded-DNA-specific exonuclease RecJ [Candidatus Sericytochromatia bacterium]
MATWGLRPVHEGEVDALAAALGVPRAVARLHWLRGRRTAEAARGFVASREAAAFLAAPLETPGMARAVARVRQAIAAGERMVIYGDYDCDGVTSTSLLYRYLARGCGANVEAYLPDRFRDGYGVTPAAVERLAAQGVQLILTCDNGVSAHAAAERARALGVTLVVTDHHQVPEALPDVEAIVHPQLEFRHLSDLAGVGVAFLFAIALEGGYTDRMQHFLDLVAIGTIGDVVPLDGPNRPLVWGGLSRFRAGASRFPGVAALARVAGRDLTTLTARDVAFALAPRLNAAGRLETPDVGFRLLTTNDRAEAARLAEELDRLNRARRALSDELEAALTARLDREWDLEAEPFIVVADAQLHHGVTGIIAGRLKERYRVPVLLFSGHDDALWKASGRSPEGLHLYNALHAARAHLHGFGGHAGAAGCSARPDALPAVREALVRHVRESGWTRPADTVWLDAELPLAEADEGLLEALAGLEPFGARNEAPTFGLLRARVVRHRAAGRHLFLQLDDGRTVREVVWWGHAGEDLPPWVAVSYAPRRTFHEGGWRLQLGVERLEPATPPEAVTLRPPAARRAPRFEDRRGEAGPWPAADTTYALARGSRPGAVLGPLDAVPPEPGRVVLVDVPEDLATLQALTSRATHVTLAWALEAPPEPALTAEALLQWYDDMVAAAGQPLGRVLASRGPGYAPAAACRVLVEAGLLVERLPFWQVLAAPEGPISLASLATYRAAAEGRAFRSRLRAAPLAEIIRLAGG